ncbi:MAG: hypothetical protein ACT4PE_09195 [Candidatus Eiseniibacteriota bacterium]
MIDEILRDVARTMHELVDAVEQHEASHQHAQQELPAVFQRFRTHAKSLQLASPGS